MTATVQPSPIRSVLPGAPGRQKQVGIVRAEPAVYPTIPPYDPGEPYPEYPFGSQLSSEANPVYDAVRRLFRALGYDAEGWGTVGWNPLGHLIEPGMTVVIKPNWVLSRHPQGKDVYSIITHPSVLRAVADYCWIALHGQGALIIADAPEYDCNFAELMSVTGLPLMSEMYARHGGPEVSVRDLRSYWSAGRHFPSMTRPLAGDPEGRVMVDVGGESALGPRPADRFYGAVYHRNELFREHTDGRHRYEFSGTMLKADVLVSVPKLKVHKKVGVTLNLKGLMGTVTNKNLCVHYSLGSPHEGGDQYPDGWFNRREEALIKIERWMYDHLLAPRSRPLEYLHRSIYWLHGRTLRPLGLKVRKEKRLLDAGNWFGNDSAWRMVDDLARIIHFADSEGRLHETQQRRTLSVVDGVVGGENNGPLAPDPKPAGVLIGGEGFAAVDLAATRWMGFDPSKLKQFNILLDALIDLGIRRLDDLEVATDDPTLQARFADLTDRGADFKPHPGWLGEIEL